MWGLWRKLLGGVRNLFGMKAVGFDMDTGIAVGMGDVAVPIDWDLEGTEKDYIEKGC